MPFGIGIALTSSIGSSSQGTGTPGESVLNVMVDGDSFLASNSPNFATTLKRKIDIGWGYNRVTVNNAASSGNNWQNMVSAGAANVDAHYNAAANKNLLIHGQGWINQRLLLGEAVYPTSDVRAKQYFSDRAAAGWYVMIFPNQVTAYNETTLSEVGGDSAALARFHEWEFYDEAGTGTGTGTGPYPGIPPYPDNSSRWLADYLVDQNPSLYCHQILNRWRTDLTWRSKFYERLAYSRWPELFGNPDSTSSGGKSHPLAAGENDKSTCALAEIIDYLELDPPTDIIDSLRSVWPLWGNVTPTPAPSVAPNLDYWCKGTNNLNQASDAVQSDEYVELGRNPFSGASYLQTATSGGAISAHNLHGRSTFTINLLIYPKIITNSGVTMTLLHVVGEYMLRFNFSAGVFRFQTWRDSGGVNTDTVDSTVTVALNQWHMVTCGYDGTNIFIQVNDEAKQTTSAASVYGGTTNEFTVGQGYNGYYKWLMWLDQAITPTQRTYLRDRGNAMTTLFKVES